MDKKNEIFDLNPEVHEDSEEEINYDELTSHKIEKNVASEKRKKRLIVILEHAYFKN